MEGGGGDPAHGSAAASRAAGARDFNEEVVRRYCDQYNDEMKGQAGTVWNAKPVYASLWSFFEFMNVFQEKRNRKF